VSLCLNLIVRNEGAIIDRLIDSVAAFTSCYVACDTGSSDDTPQRIQNGFARHGVPGELHHAPFEDFSQARNLALDKARASSLHFDYLLLADADMELVVEDATVLKGLGLPAYHLRQTSANTSYDNIRLLRRDASARYVGYTHEYLRVEGEVGRLNGLRFRDHADGSNRSQKLERDLKLLLRQLEDDPEDVRAMFYLGETCRYAGRWAEAAAWYSLRIQGGGFEEEIWYSHLQRALCYLAMADERRFLAECMLAYSRRPWRNEPLLELARYYRSKGMPEVASLYAESASMPYPSQDRLFVTDSGYGPQGGIGPLAELSTSARNSALPWRKERGGTACRQLLRDPASDSATINRALIDLLDYPCQADRLFAGAQIRPLQTDGLRAYDPSLATHDGQLFAVLRTSNYDYREHRFVSRDADGIFRTHNYLCRLDDDLRVLDCQPLDESTLEPALPGPVRGFEDCRLFRRSGNWWCTATCLDRDLSGQPRVALFCLGDDGRLSHLRRLPALWQECEKNWVPLLRGDELFFLYTSGGPLRILDEQLETVYLQETPAFLNGLRGGSPALALPTGGWLSVARHAVFPADGSRNYLHRLLRFDSSFRLVAGSDPFCFLEPGIEYCAGLALRDHRLWLSFGRNECEAHCLTLPFEDGAGLFSWSL